MNARTKVKSKKEQQKSDIRILAKAELEVEVETVDFSDPNRPKTCLEVDFPIIPVNRVAIVEGNAGKPIYQMSKWWARRRSSVFRALLLAAGMKAPDDTSHAAKAVWDVFYSNHQRKKKLSTIAVADIFMGGGTTVVEGLRLGMQMHGVDLNPVAWFIVKNEILHPKRDELDRVLEHIESVVKPALAPYYACECPRGHRGRWTKLGNSHPEIDSFDPIALSLEERSQFRYEGPEIIYTFWAKHGPCPVTGCGHRTPIISDPVVAIKEFSVDVQSDVMCKNCSKTFDVEFDDVRLAPGEALVVAESEKAFVALEKGLTTYVTCPFCANRVLHPFKKSGKKKISSALVIHPEWLKGSSSKGTSGEDVGGRPGDSVSSSAAWLQERCASLRLIEVRGEMPQSIDLGKDHKAFNPKAGTVPSRSRFACGSCGSTADVLDSIKATGSTGAFAPFAIQGFCPDCARDGQAYGGRFFSSNVNLEAILGARREWDSRSAGDLEEYWPKSELPYGFMTTLNNGGLHNHGFTHWWKMFEPRQLLGLSQLLREIDRVSDRTTSHFILGAFQQFLRNQNLFCIWDISRDCLAPALSNANFHPKATAVENGFFGRLGRGNWRSSVESLGESIDWSEHPWDHYRNIEGSAGIKPEVVAAKLTTGDRVIGDAKLHCMSATDLKAFDTGTMDLVITDPPFGGLLHYSELSDFFYVWLRLILRKDFPEYFSAEYSPKTLEVVANRARNPEDADAFYRRLLTDSWREAHRILKAGGILAFTFHHSEDEPWVDVLQSLFDAGFYLEATYPVRSDETKGEGSKPGTFGSQTIEYDIVHVCRKRLHEPAAISWPRLRRQIIDDVQQMKTILQHHSAQGLPDADLQVIKRGKALEYFSRHYGKVFVDEGREFTVRDALLGINQLIGEDSSDRGESLPPLAEPFSRQFLSLFKGAESLARDQIQKFLKGTGAAPSDFVARGWCVERKKVFYQVHPLELARGWIGKSRAKLICDLDQALFLIGACVEGSGINASDTLNNANLRPHPALESLLDWYRTSGWLPEIRSAAHRAQTIFQAWKRSHQKESAQMDLFING